MLMSSSQKIDLVETNSLIGRLNKIQDQLVERYKSSNSPADRMKLDALLEKFYTLCEIANIYPDNFGYHNTSAALHPVLIGKKSLYPLTMLKESIESLELEINTLANILSSAT